MFWGSLQVCMFICSSDDNAPFVQFVICHWYVAVASLSNFLYWLMLMNWYVVLHSVSILFFLFFFCSVSSVCLSHSVCFCYHSLKVVFGFISFLLVLVLLLYVRQGLFPWPNFVSVSLLVYANYVLVPCLVEHVCQIYVS